MRSDLYTPKVGAEEPPRGPVTHSPDSLLKMRLARTFGLTHELRLVPDARGIQRAIQAEPFPAEVKGYRGLRDAYLSYIPYDTSFEHIGDHRVTAIFNTGSFSSALADTAHQMLLEDIGGGDPYRWRSIVTSTTQPRDFRALERVRLGYIEDVPEVGEDSVYDELVTHGDESISYAVTTRGGRLTVTRRAFINDDVMAVRRAVQQAGRACWRTLAKRCWQKLIANDDYLGDGLAVFHSSHGNLGSAALSAAALSAARQAIFNQVELGSSEKLGLGGKLLLVVPLALEDAAYGINQTMYTDASFTPNPWFHCFGENNENIFVNPLLTDDDDWYVLDISGNVGLLEIGFLMGRQEPEVVLGDSPTAGETMLQDRIIFKLRHEYEVAISDYRGMYKSVV
jgi:hypothetical protein